MKTLEQCKSDGDLLTLSIVANTGDARAWLERVVAIEFGSEHPFIQARSVVLAAMLGVDAPKFVPDSWLDEVSDNASQYRDRGAWARAWFNRFLSASRSAAS